MGPNSQALSTHSSQSDKDLLVSGLGVGGRAELRGPSQQAPPSQQESLCEGCIFLMIFQFGFHVSKM